MQCDHDDGAGSQNELQDAILDPPPLPVGDVPVPGAVLDPLVHPVLPVPPFVIDPKAPGQVPADAARRLSGDNAPAPADTIDAQPPPPKLESAKGNPKTPPPAKAAKQKAAPAKAAEPKAASGL